jgi:hypothetical protein
MARISSYISSWYANFQDISCLIKKLEIRHVLKKLFLQIYLLFSKEICFNFFGTLKTTRGCQRHSQVSQQNRNNLFTLVSAFLYPNECVVEWVGILRSGVHPRGSWVFRLGSMMLWRIDLLYYNKRERLGHWPRATTEKIKKSHTKGHPCVTALLIAS